MERLRLKWIAALAGALGAVLLVAAYLIEAQLERRLIAASEADLLRRASFVALWLADDPGADAVVLHARAQRAAEAASGRITLIARDGHVIADSEVAPEDVDELENHIDRPEVRSALAGTPLTSRRLSNTVKRSLLYGAVPVAGGDVAVVRVASELELLDAALTGLRGGAAFGGAVGLLAAIALAFMLSALWLRPISAIRDTVQSIAAGALEARVPWRSADAFGEVARAIDAMAEQLQARLAELSGEKEQLQAVLRAMAEGVLVVDASGSIALANRRLRELFGLRSAVEQRTPIEVIRNARVQEALDAARSGVELVSIEVERVPGPSYLRMQAVPLRTPNGVGAVAVFHDVTELRRLEAVRRDFVANASHELKTPITAIRGFAELLVGTELADTDRERFVRVILRHSDRVAALVEDLLELSRIEASGALEGSPLEIEPLLRARVGELDGMFAARSLSVEVSSIDVRRVRADPSALQRVLHCLLDNAAKYTEPGGKICVRAERAGEQRVRIAVADTGIGIPRAHQQRIFERFYRVDRARSREVGGTGLGLAIVRHWVERMGGEVGVESEPGRGSTFWFTLPTAT